MAELSLEKQGIESERYVLPSYMNSDSLYSIVGKLDWGYSYCVGSYGKYIYYGNGSLIKIIDASTPDDSVFAEYDCEGIAQDMIVQGKFIYLVNTKGLEIIDLTLPLSPVKRSMIRITGAMKIAVRDTLAFVASIGGGVSVISIVNLDYPFILSSFYGGGDRIRSIACSKNTVFVGNDVNSDLVVVDVTNPSLPISKSVDIGGRAFSLLIEDTLLFLTTSQSFKIYELKSPNDPVLLGSLIGFTRGKITAITKKENLVYVATSDSGQYMFDVMDIFNPILLFNNRQFKHLGIDPTGLVVNQGKLYYSGYSGLAIFNCSDDDSLTLKDIKPSGGYAYKICVQDSIAYIASSLSGLWIIDISDPRHLKPISNIQFGGISSDIAIRDSIVYVLNKPSAMALKPSDGIFVVNVKNSLSPKLINRYVGVIKYSADNLGSTFLINNNKLVVGNGTNDVSDTCVEILDITNPMELKRLSVIKSKLDPTCMAIDDSLIFIGTSSDGLKIFSYQDSIISSWKGSHFVGNFINSIIKQDKYLYLDHGSSFRIAEYINPSTVITTGHYYRLDQGFGNWSTMVLVLNNIVWSSGYYFGIIDVANVSLPFEKNRIDNTFLNYTFAVKSNFAFLGMEGGPIYSINVAANLLSYKDNSNNQTPDRSILYQNYPNPFNGQTTISAYFHNNGICDILIYDSIGRLIKHVNYSIEKAGSYEFTLNTEKYASGSYFYSLRFKDYVMTKKMVHIK